MLNKSLSRLAMATATMSFLLLSGNSVAAQATAAAPAASQPAIAKKPVATKSKVKAKAETPKAVAAATPAALAWPTQLASCKSEAGMNPIKREICVWKYCKGNWGKGGCPEEAKPQPHQSSD